MSEPIIEVENLWRTFDGLNAVQGVNFSVDPGKVVGFIGANGAGKTTTMKIMATLDTPTQGSVRIGGFDVVHERVAARRLIGWMPDSYGAYEDMTVLEYLDFFARAYGFGSQERKHRLAEVMEFTRLDELATREMNELSKGMSQRLCLGRMLIPDPDVLILDEPAAGLDPQARVEFKHLVRVLAEEEKTLFISSHILSELEDMCDSILFINRGAILHHGDADQIKDIQGQRVVVEVQLAGDVEKLIEWIQLQPDLEAVEKVRNGVRVAVESADPNQLHKLLARMVRAELPVSEFHVLRRKLEDAFVDLLASIREEDE